MSCECEKFVYQECDHCFKESVQASEPYQELVERLKEAKRLVRRAKWEINHAYGKVQDDTMKALTLTVK